MLLSPQSVFILVTTFLVALLVLITILYLFGPAPKKMEYIKEEEHKLTFEEIQRVLENQKKSLEEIKHTVNLFFQNYDKLELSEYKKRQFLFAVVVHRNTSTELIMQVDSDLRQLNPDMDRDLTSTLNRALDAREFNK